MAQVGNKLILTIYITHNTHIMHNMLSVDQSVNELSIYQIICLKFKWALILFFKVQSSLADVMCVPNPVFQSFLWTCLSRLSVAGSCPCFTTFFSKHTQCLKTMPLKAISKAKLQKFWLDRVLCSASDFFLNQRTSKLLVHFLSHLSCNQHAIKCNFANICHKLSCAMVLNRVSCG